MTRLCSAFIAGAIATLVMASSGKTRPAEAAPTPSPGPSDPCGGAGRLLATANRPTIGYSSCAVKRDTAVFELGYQNQVGGTPTVGTVESQVPQTFLRLGIATRFEFDVIGPNYIGLRAYSPSASETTIHGVADSGIGFKYELPPADRWIVALDGLYTGPNGSPSLSAGNATLTGNLDASYSMSSAVSIGTTVAISSTGSFSHGTHYQYGVTTPSVVATAQIPHYYQFYAEYVFVSKTGATAGDRAFTDFGIQKLLSRSTEVDIEYAQAFTGIPNQRFNYIGFGLVQQFW